MIKQSHHGYITIKRYDLYKHKAVYVGENDGDRAKFLLLTGRHTEPFVWLKRDEIFSK